MDWIQPRYPYTGYPVVSGDSDTPQLQLMLGRGWGATKDIRRRLDGRVPAQEMVRHTAQLTCQFIRLVRHCLARQTSWRDALPLFQRRLDSYL
jgi:hypothetical protein